MDVGRCIGHAAARRRGAPLEHELLPELDIPASWLPELAESTDAGRAPSRAFRSPRAPGIRRRPRSAPGSPGPARSRSCSARRGWCSPATKDYLPTRGSGPRLLPCRPGSVDGDGRDALGRRVARLVSRHAASRRALRRDARRSGARRARVRGADFSPTSPASGRRTPTRDARGAFCGLSVTHGRGALTRAVLEGVAFALRDCLDTVRDVGRRRQSRGRVSGGGSRSRLWLEIVASALEVPLEMMATDQGSAFGAALLGGVASGVYRDLDQASTACVRVTEVVDPVAGWIEPYREARHRFRALLPGAALGQVDSSRIRPTGARRNGPAPASARRAPWSTRAPRHRAAARRHRAASDG